MLHGDAGRGSESLEKLGRMLQSHGTKKKPQNGAELLKRYG